jgi:hypothetical protein
MIVPTNRAPANVLANGIEGAEVCQSLLLINAFHEFTATTTGPQQVENYEYEQPSDFGDDDEEIDEELAFTTEDKARYGGWFDEDGSEGGDEANEAGSEDAWDDDDGEGEGAGSSDGGSDGEQGEAQLEVGAGRWEGGGVDGRVDLCQGVSYP